MLDITVRRAPILLNSLLAAKVITVHQDLVPWYLVLQAIIALATILRHPLVGAQLDGIAVGAQTVPLRKMV
jgi:hypothetical protein